MTKSSGDLGWCITRKSKHQGVCAPNPLERVRCGKWGHSTHICTVKEISGHECRDSDHTRKHCPKTKKDFDFVEFGSRALMDVSQVCWENLTCYFSSCLSFKPWISLVKILVIVEVSRKYYLVLKCMEIATYGFCKVLSMDLCSATRYRIL